MERQLVCIALLFAQVSQGQSARVRSLLQDLHEPSKAQAASVELRGLATTSAEIMKQTEESLAEQLKLRPDPAAFRREVDLARELNLSHLAPVIAQSLDDDTRDNDERIGGFSQRNGPETDPAMKALMSFGSASIPSLVKQLNTGNKLGRFRAAHALAGVGGPEANAALRDRYAREPDPGIKGYLGFKSGVLNGGS